MKTSTLEFEIIVFTLKLLINNINFGFPTLILGKNQLKIENKNFNLGNSNSKVRISNYFIFYKIRNIKVGDKLYFNSM